MFKLISPLDYLSKNYPNNVKRLQKEESQCLIELLKECFKFNHEERLKANQLLKLKLLD